MAIKITAKKVQGVDLQPGDLFSTAGPDYWLDAMNKGSVGERVFIRTNISAHQFSDAASPVYLIQIQYDNGDNNGTDT